MHVSLRAHHLVAAMCVVAAAALFPGPALAATPALHVERLTVEHLPDPLGIDAPAPRLGWILDSDRRDQRQTAYQVQVATSRSALLAGEPDVWDSGRVASAESSNVAYGGPAQRSATRHHWRVRAWDAAGRPSPWSEPGWWETGLLAADDWSARWIAPASGAAGGSYLRTSFSLPAEPVRARAYAAGRGAYERGPDGQGICCEQAFGLARGIYDLTVNGERAGTARLESQPVDTRDRALYRTYDVTSLLREGENAVGVMIGEDSDVLVQLEITLADGSTVRVGTGEDWRTAPGPVVRAHRFNGETYDARRALPGWDRPGFDAAGWSPARVVPGARGTMTAAALEPMRVVRTHAPVEISSPAPGVHVLDFGVNMAGWTRLDVDVPAGTQIAVKHGERLSSSGRVDNGQIVAQQTNRYTAAGVGRETWEPRFVYAGFRYVEVTGLPEAPDPGTVVAREVHNDVPATGSFTSSDDLLNRLHRASVQTQLNGLHGIPEDTPTREKRGWMADAHIAAEALINNFGMNPFYAKFVRDMRDAQQPSGEVPDIVPVEPTTGWENRSDPAWSAATVLIPTYLHQRYGDTRVLEQHYDSMTRWLDYVATTTEGHLVTRPSQRWGNDWVSIEETDGTLFRSLFYFWTVRATASAAATLGRADDAERYEALAADIAEAVNDRYLDRATGSYGDTQFANAFPLLLGVVPEDREDDVLAALVADVEEHGGHFTGGLPGIKYIPEALEAYGRSDLVLEVVRKTDYPGWGYMLENGPGTIWEIWNGDSSRNHPMFSSIDDWLYRAVGGIGQADGSVGYRRLVFAPRVTDDLDSAEASIETPYGMARSAWEHRDGRLVQRVRVPVNATAEVHVPAESRWAAVESGWFAATAEGVHDVREEDGTVVVTVGSGEYEFTTDVALGRLGEAAARLRELRREIDRLSDSSERDRQALLRDTAAGAAAVQAALDAYRRGEQDALRHEVEGALRHVHRLAATVERSRTAALRATVRAVAHELSRLAADLAGVTLRAEAADRELLPGESATATVTLRNDGETPLVGAALAVDAPAGWTADAEPLGAGDAVEPGEEVSARITLRSPAGQRLGPVSIAVTVDFLSRGARVSLPAIVDLEVVTPAAIDAVHAVPRVLDGPGAGATLRVALRSLNPGAAVPVQVAATELPDGWAAGGPRDVTLPPGGEQAVELPLSAGADAEPGGAIRVEATAGGQRLAHGTTAAYLRGAGCAADPAGEACLRADFRLLHNFEDGVEGWVAEANVSTPEAVRSFANGPGTPKLGRRALEAWSHEGVAGREWRTVSVTPPAPVPVGDAPTFVYHVNGYGGAPGTGSYQSRIVLTGTGGERLERVTAIGPDRWNEVRIDLRDWGAIAIASIAISFRADTGASWRPRFQVDQVGLDASPPPPDPAGNLAAGAPVSARVSLECCAWGARMLTDGQRFSSGASRGYTSDPWQTTADAVEWVSVDLGERHTIGSVWLHPRTATGGEPAGTGGANYPERFEIQVSDDGASWTTVRSLSGQSSDGDRGQGYEVPPTAARHVRIHATRLGRPAPDEAGRGFHRLQLAELEVYGTRGEP